MRRDNAQKAIKAALIFGGFTMLGEILHNHLLLFGISLILAGIWVNIHNSEQYE